MKRTALLIIGLFAALAAVVLIVPSFFNWNSQKELIQERASAALGQSVRIEGDLSLAILPRPRLSAKGLSVGDRTALTEGPFIAAELVDIQVAFLPLLSGKIKANTILLQQPKIVVQTGQSEAQETSGEPGAQPDIALPEVIVQGGSVVFVDAATNQETRISNINVTLAAQSINGPFAIDGALNFEDKPLDLTVKTGRLDEPNFPFEAKLATAGGSAFTAALNGTASDILGRSPRAQASLNVNARDLGQTLQQLTGAPAPTLSGQRLRVEGDVSLAGERLLMPAITVALGDIAAQASGEVVFSGPEIAATLTLSAGRVDITPYMTGDTQTDALLEPIEAALPSGIKATIKADIDRLDGLPVPLQRIAMAARLTDGRVDVSLTRALLPGGVSLTTDLTFKDSGGQLMGPFKARILGANAAPLLSQLLGPDSTLPPSPIPLDLQLDGALERKDVRLKALVGSIGETTLNASASAAYGPAPRAAVTARLGRVNADHWIGNGDTKAPTTPPETPAFSGTINADVQIASLLRGGEVYDDLRLVGSVKDDTATLETLSLGRAPGATVSASGRVSGLSKDAAGLNLAFKASGKTAGQLMALAGQAPSDILEKAGSVSVSGQITGTSQAPDIAISGAIGTAKLAANAQLTKLDSKAPAMRGNATLSHPNLGAFLAKLDLMDQAQQTPSAQAFQLEAQFNSVGESLSAQLNGGTKAGQIKARYDAATQRQEITFNANAPDLTTFVRSLGIGFDPTGAQLGGLKANIALEGPDNALVSRTLELEVGPARLSGSGKIDMSGAVTQVDLRLTGDNLDLARLLPQADTGAQQVASGTGQRWSKEPLDLAILESVDGVIRLDMNRLTWQAYELQNASASISSQGRNVRMGLDRGVLFNGPASFAVTLDGKDTPKLSLEMAIKDGDVAKATQSSAAIAPLTGTFNLNGDFTGSGISEYDIVKTLNGQARFSAQDGMVNGIDIVRINERFGTLNTVADFVQIAGSALTGGETHYDLIAVDLIASNGLLTTQNMQTKIDGGAQATLDTRINLPEWQVQANGGFSLADHPQAPPVGVRIAGRLDTPQIKYETKQIQNYLGARFGAAVIKGVIKGDGFGFKDILGGGQTEDQAQDPNAQAEPDPSQQVAPNEPQATPEEKLRDLILEGIFGGRRQRSP
ncbi:MAG: AsmA family protein [Pseudomonadota bacterium]